MTRALVNLGAFLFKRPGDASLTARGYTCTSLVDSLVTLRHVEGHVECHRSIVPKDNQGRLAVSKMENLTRHRVLKYLQAILSNSEVEISTWGSILSTNKDDIDLPEIRKVSEHSPRNSGSQTLELLFSRDFKRAKVEGSSSRSVSVYGHILRERVSKSFLKVHAKTWCTTCNGYHMACFRYITCFFRSR